MALCFPLFRDRDIRERQIRFSSTLHVFKVDARCKADYFEHTRRDIDHREVRLNTANHTDAGKRIRAGFDQFGSALSCAVHRCDENIVDTRDQVHRATDSRCRVITTHRPVRKIAGL